MTSIYDFSLENQNGEEIPLSHYQGKVLIVVNTATGCGLTPQYQGLQDLYLRYQEKGLEILDIPCNQFMGQAPGTAEEINSFCSLNYQTTFPRFAKAKVNGKEALPLYDWLKRRKLRSLHAQILSVIFLKALKRSSPVAKNMINICIIHNLLQIRRHHVFDTRI